VISVNKSTAVVGFGFAQPTKKSRVERSRNSSTWVCSLSEITLEEVQQIPDAKLAQLYEMIHGFRLSSETNNHNAAIIQFAGCWSEMSDEAYGNFQMRLLSVVSKHFLKH